MEQAEPGKADAVSAGRSPYSGKRLFDVVVGLLLSILTLPIVLVLATIAAVKFRTSPFFVQERVGLNGEPFRCIKIRSLPAETPAYLDKTALNDHCEPTGWCRFLRRFHLDELPQFWQVVGGSMSLVGPRPMIASIIEGMPRQAALTRQSIRPGVTGPWQVSVDGAHSLLDCLDYDEAYVHSASLVLDLKLVILTAVQTIGLPKRDRDRVFAMMSSAPVVGLRVEDGVVALRQDPECADVRTAS